MEKKPRLLNTGVSQEILVNEEVTVNNDSDVLIATANDVDNNQNCQSDVDNNEEHIKLVETKEMDTNNSQNSLVLINEAIEEEQVELSLREVFVEVPVLEALQFIQNKISKVYSGFRSFFKRPEININRGLTQTSGLDPEVFQKLPVLTADPERDIYLKNSLISFLYSTITISQPLHENFRTIANYSFSENIDKENLIKFLNSKIILGLILKYTILDNVEDDKENDVTLKDKYLDQLARHIQVFEKNYDPYDNNFTISKFLQELQSQKVEGSRRNRTFNDFKLKKFLLENIDMFSDFILKNKTGKILPNLISKFYLENGKNNPDKFIKLVFPQFLKAVRKDIRLTVNNKRLIKNVQIVDLDWFENDFCSELNKLVRKNLSTSQLKKLLYDNISDYFDRVSGDIDFFQVELEKIISKKGLEMKLKKIISNNITEKVKGSNLTSFTASISEIPTRLTESYKTFFNDDKTSTGMKYSKDYYSQIRGMFSVIESSAEKEEFGVIRKRLEILFLDVDNFISELNDNLDLGVDISPEIQGQGEYAELVRLAVKSSDERVRYAARVKLDISRIIYNLRLNAQNVFKDWNSEQVWKRFVNAKDGISIRNNIETQDDHGFRSLKSVNYEFFTFSENENGEVNRVNNNEEIIEEASNLEQRNFDVPLLPGSFGGVDGYFISADYYYNLIKDLLGNSFSNKIYLDGEINQHIKLIYACYIEKKTTSLKNKLINELVAYISENYGITLNKDEVWPSIQNSKYSVEKKIESTDFLSLNNESDTINSDKELAFESSTLYEEKRFKIINTKTEYSLITKLIRKNLREDEITDVLRMTFVVDNEEKLKRVSKHIETNYTSFGRELKIENRGYEHIVSTSTSSTVKHNSSKSNDYKSLRYVLKIPIRSEKGQKPHAREVEIRILHVDDLAKERSQYHHASHDAYKKRREIECAETLYPRELYPELYDTVQDEYDVFGRKDYQLIVT